MTLTGARWRGILIVCAVGLGLLGLLWSAMRVGGQGPEIVSPNLDVILLIDNSLGMSQFVENVPPSDPEGLRIRAARFLVDYLSARAQRTHANYRIGVASFGGKISDTIPLTLLQDDSIRNRIRLESVPFTDFRAPLKFARGEFQSKECGENCRRAIILFTDAEPWIQEKRLTGAALDQYFAPDSAEPDSLGWLRRDLDRLGIQVFVLGIGDAEKNHALWDDLLGADNYVSVSKAQDLNDIYHSLISRLLGQESRPAAMLPSGDSILVTVEPYLELVTFSFMKSDPAIQITVTDSLSRTVLPNAGGQTGVYDQIYAISNPVSGTWQISWIGKGSVEYWVARQLPSAPVSLSVPFPYTGQPITITAGLLRNGVVITDSTLRFDAEIVAPNAVTLTRSLDPLSNGYHSRVVADVLRSDGTYTIKARVFLKGEEILGRPVPAVAVIMSLPPTPIVTPWSNSTQQPTATLAQAPLSVSSPTTVAGMGIPTPGSGASGETPTPSPGTATQTVWQWPTGYWWVALAIAAVTVGIVFLIVKVARRRYLRAPSTGDDFDAVAQLIRTKLENAGWRAALPFFCTYVEKTFGGDFSIFPTGIEARRRDNMEKARKGHWESVGAILVDLQFGGLGEDEKSQKRTSKFVSSVRKRLCLDQPDTSELTWIADKYLPEIAESQDGILKQRVADTLVKEAELLDAIAYKPAQSAVKQAVSYVLNDQTLDERSRWLHVAQYLWTPDRVPALVDGVAEALWERLKTPESGQTRQLNGLQDTLMLADACIVRSPPSKAMQDAYLLAGEIMDKVAGYAAGKDDQLVREIGHAFRALSLDVAYRSTSIWSNLSKLRSALLDDGAEAFAHRDELLALLRLYGAVDPYELEYTAGYVRLGQVDRRDASKYPGADKIVEALELLENKTTCSQELQDQIEKKLEEGFSDSADSPRPRFLVDSLKAVVDVWKGTHVG